MIAEERLLAEGGCPRQDVWCETGFGQADEWELGDEGILGCCQDKPEVAVMAPSAGNLNRRCVRGWETIRVSDVAVARFPRLIGEAWGR